MLEPEKGKFNVVSRRKWERKFGGRMRLCGDFVGLKGKREAIYGKFNFCAT